MTARVGRGGWRSAACLSLLCCAAILGVAPGAAAAPAWVEPRAGLATFGRLQQRTADLAYTTAETNFTLGLAGLSARLHRRSLVVLLTDFVDTVTAALMVENVGRLARRQAVARRDPGGNGAQVDEPVLEVDAAAAEGDAHADARRALQFIRPQHVGDRP